MSADIATQPRMAKLTKANYQTWIAQARDYILAIDHDDAITMWHIYEWTPDPAVENDVDPIDHDYQTASTAPQKKLRTLHNKAWQFLRQNLSQKIFDTTHKLRISVPVLLRHLRANWHEHSPNDRAALVSVYREMKLSNYQDMDEYVTAFENQVHTLREYKIGSAAEDEDVLYQFELGLPEAWTQFIATRTANSLNYDQALAFYKGQAKAPSNHRLPGAPNKGGHRPTADTAHVTMEDMTDRIFTTVEVCRNFARGKCTRPNGTCRYFHPSTTTKGHQQPAPTGRTNQPRSTPSKGKLYCVYCRVRDDHECDTCPQLKRKREREEASRKGHDTTHATVDQLVPQFDDMAWATAQEDPSPDSDDPPPVALPVRVSASMPHFTWVSTHLASVANFGLRRRGIQLTPQADLAAMEAAPLPYEDVYSDMSLLFEDSGRILAQAEQLERHNAAHNCAPATDMVRQTRHTCSVITSAYQDMTRARDAATQRLTSARLRLLATCPPSPPLSPRHRRLAAANTASGLDQVLLALPSSPTDPALELQDATHHSSRASVRNPPPPVPPIRSMTPLEEQYAADYFDEPFDDVFMALPTQLATATRLQPAPGNILMLLDGASTCWVVMDEALCTDIQPANIRIRVGSDEGKSHIVHCKQTGIFPFTKHIDGRLVTMRPRVRICPGFGCHIMPETAYLSTQPPHTINKSGAHVRIHSPIGDLVMTAEAQRYDSSWLPYTEVTPLAALGSRGTLICGGLLTSNKQPPTHALRTQNSAVRTQDSAVVTGLVPDDVPAGLHAHPTDRWQHHPNAVSLMGLPTPDTSLSVSSGPNCHLKSDFAFKDDFTTCAAFGTENQRTSRPTNVSTTNQFLHRSRPLHPDPPQQPVFSNTLKPPAQHTDHPTSNSPGTSSGHARSKGLSVSACLHTPTGPRTTPRSTTSKLPPSPSPSSTTGPGIPNTTQDPLHFTTDPATYCHTDSPAEVEARALLPFQSEIAACYKTREKSGSPEDFQRWHEKLGHRNSADTARISGIPTPPSFQCQVCLLSKSTRHRLTARAWPLHDSPRPDYAYQWDHAGPFAARTWGGNNYASLMICVFSGKLFLRMTNTVSSCFEEWVDHVNRLRAHHGRQQVARMITDNAPYFQSRMLRDFNTAEGIVHVPCPSYTQEFNGSPERTWRTLLSMVRACLHDAHAPKAAFGECLMAMAYILDRCPHVAGGQLTRLEKYMRRLLPDQHDHLHPWGCAAYLHLEHGTRGQVEHRTKLDPNAALCMFVGWDANGLGYRLARLPGFKIVTSPHVTFVESHMPLKVGLYKQPWPSDTPNFMTPTQVAAYFPPPGLAPAVAELPTSTVTDRPVRAWAPSAARLEAIASMDPPRTPVPPLPLDSPPESSFASSQQDLELDLVYAFRHDTMTDHPTSDQETKVVNIQSALAGPQALKWSQAIIKEHSSHVKNGTFGPPLAKLPPGFRAVPFDCLGKIKRDGVYKARGIIKGFHMKEGRDYNDTFAPVPVITTIRLLFALAAKFDWEIKQGDVETAFLCADMDTEVYVSIPCWFSENQSKHRARGFTIHRLLKAVPGIPQGPRLYHKKSHHIFTGQGLKQCRSDHSLYVCTTRKLYLVVWVDDCFLFFPKESLAHARQLWTALRAHLPLDEWEDVDDCLGVQVRRDRPNSRLTLSQRAPVEKLLRKLNMLDGDWTPECTPIPSNAKFSKADCPTPAEALTMAEEQRTYRSVLATLIYFYTWTRPAIGYAVSKLCKFMHNPGHAHFALLKRLLRFMRSTRDHGLVYDFGPRNASIPKAYGLYDAAHADCIDTLRSTLAYIFFLAGCPISWHTKLHTYITTSTNHSEYCAASKASSEAVWLQNVLLFLDLADLCRPIPLFSDSRGAIAMVYNPVQRSASKHVDLADHYAREQQDRGVITISWLETRRMIADILTKALPKAPFVLHASMIEGPI